MSLYQVFSVLCFACEGKISEILAFKLYVHQRGEY